MLRFIFSVAFLFLLWLGLSGIYKPLVVGLGLGSAVFAVMMARRMNKYDAMGALKIALRPLAVIGYILWLIGEIAKANLIVARIILTPSTPNQQKFFTTPTTQKTDLGCAIFANSITLTPGTITVEVEEKTLLVHALAFAPSDTIALADMNARACKVEI